MNFSPLSPFMWARVVKKYTSETVGNTFSPFRPGLTGEKVPKLKNEATLHHEQKNLRASKINISTQQG